MAKRQLTDKDAHSRAQHNLFFHMLEQVDGLEYRLTRGAKLSLASVDQTFPSHHAAVADELEAAIDILDAVITPQPSADASLTAARIAEPCRDAEDALATLEGVRTNLVKVRTGLQCLRYDIVKLGGERLHQAVVDENERTGHLRQRVERVTLAGLGRRTMSMPLLGHVYGFQLA
ncbi:hypothetical protein LTR62_005804 [Meristemomyces frigidus]|uniref:Uncharacterized protein n=1 Tax=Meristemomyces frigidus TaxID=1508187 RepID=A0AAN7TKE1_9PEZI|nr:hypothetical protein LTR62_005804 [Meristemomyces frigidus]